MASSLAVTRATPWAWQYRLVYLQSKKHVVVELWTPDLAVGGWGRCPLFSSYLLIVQWCTECISFPCRVSASLLGVRVNFTAIRHRIRLLGSRLYSLRRIRGNLLSNVSIAANETGADSISSRTVYLEVLESHLISRTTSATIEASTVRQHWCNHRQRTASVHLRFKKQMHLAECERLVHWWKSSLSKSYEM